MKKLIPLLVVGMVLCVGCERKIVGTVLSKRESLNRVMSYEITVVETNTYSVHSFYFEHAEVGRPIVIKE